MQEILSRQKHNTRRLIPTLITQNLAKGELQGNFPAAGLYLDLSGFTNLTESLIQHGTDGVEILATTVEDLFAPLIESTFAHGGFVAGYAGDAFSALFPRQPDEDDQAVALRALAAAQIMQASMRMQDEQHLAQGNYSLEAKIGLGLGDVEWGITTSDDEARAVYYFRGQAVSESALAENEAQPGDIMSGPAFYKAIASEVDVIPGNTYQLIDTAPVIEPVFAVDGLPMAAADELAHFVPASVISQSARGEFRQILSLFVNLEGRPGRDELQQIMAGVFPLLRLYGGLLYRINFDDKGCNLYVFWGAPTSQESDLQRALAFVLDLREVCDTRLRAGLSYRMAYAGFMGSPLYEEYTCYSRGVNLAARMMMAASWGEIWLDNAVAQRAEKTHRLDYIGDRQFKGFAEPEKVCRLLGRQQATAHSFFHGAFIGRETELRQLTEAMAVLDEGKPGGVYTIVGEAGIGKSRLVHEFLEHPSSAGYQVLLCQADEILKQPLNAFRYGLRRYFQLPTQGDQATAMAAFESVLDDLIAATPDEDMQDELRRTRSFIGHVIDLHWPDSLYEQVDPQLRVENTQNALKTLFKAMSRQKPLIIVLEDAHALDREGLALLPYLMRNIDGYPIAMVVMTRQQFDPDLFDPDTTQRLRHLMPLNKAATARLVEALADAPPAPALVDFLIAHSEGNPLFVEQMLLLLEQGDQGNLSSAETTTWQPTLGLDMPTDVRSLLISRLDQLPAPVRESTLVASILGREFDITTLATMLNEPPEFDALLDQGAASDIWYPLDERCYLFRHALLKDVAYDIQLGSRRRELHASAATVLEAELHDDSQSASRLAEIAYHYDHGEKAREAARYYQQAGDLAAAAYSNEQAVDYFTRALQLAGPADLETRYGMLLGREAVYGILGRRSEQLADLTAMMSALVAIPKTGRRAELLLRRAAYALVMGEYDEATSFAQQSAEVAAAEDDVIGEGRAYHRLGRTLWQQGRATEAEPFLQQALELARRGSGRLEEAECLHDLGVVWHYLGNPQAALEHLLQAREVFRTENHAQGLARCANLLGMINYALGDFAAAAEAYDEGLAKVREIGWRYAEATLLQNSSNYSFEFGQYDQARRLHEEALTIARDIHNLENESLSLDTLGLIAYCEQDIPQALEYYKQGLALARQIANERSLGYLLTHAALAMAEYDSSVEAMQLASEALNIRERLANEPAIIDTMSVLALTQLRVGDVQQAAETFERVLLWAEANDAEILELPVKWFLIGIEIFSQAEFDGETASDSRARRCLQAAHTLLQARADRLNDDRLRERYLTDVPFNRELMALWQVSQ